MQIEVWAGDHDVGDVFANEWDEMVRPPWWAFWLSRGERPMEYRIIEKRNDMAIAEPHLPWFFWQPFVRWLSTLQVEPDLEDLRQFDEWEARQW